MVKLKLLEIRLTGLDPLTVRARLGQPPRDRLSRSKSVKL